MNSTWKAALIVAVIATPAWADDCLTYETPVTLKGKVAAHPEGYAALVLEKAICVNLAPGDDLGLPASGVVEIQLNGSAAAAMSGQTVTIKGRLHPREGEHDHTQVTLDVDSVAKR